MMKDSCYKKSLIYGIIILLIGAGFIPGITGYTEKIDVQLSSEVFTSFPLGEEDYVNAYWKFDEGGGSTAHDSSGNGYDGTIYGATWTTGKIGNALDFDGVDDYIDLDQYAKNKLGFNKTDDLIVSFYFKSSSTDKGIMYSMSHDDWNYNPGFHVALASNGTIEVQVWRTMCGILTWSNDTYNDGVWHFVKICYNGISSNPLVYIYVDGDLDSIYEKYVCDFHSDNFKLAQMGRNCFEETDYFDGVLDEFKIIKYPGGDEQKPPVIDGPTYGDSGVEYDYTFTTYDPEEDDVYVLIDWDDGTEEDWRGPYDSGEVVTVSHAWDKEDIYNITARSKDFWHESRWSEDYTVKIGNQPPDPPAIDGPRYGDPDVEYTYTFRAKDLEGNDVKYYVDWDDGTTTETGYYPSNQTVELLKTWDEKDDYNITARAIDKPGEPGETSEYHIRIGDQPPHKPDIDGLPTGKPNVEIEFEFTAFDPENDQVWFDIDWDDGNIETDVGPYDSGETATISHTWNKSGTYILKARARDKFYYYSEWGDYHIKIPRVRPFDYNLFESLFERFPNMSRMLRYLPGL